MRITHRRMYSSARSNGWAATQKLSGFSFAMLCEKVFSNLCVRRIACGLSLPPSFLSSSEPLYEVRIRFHVLSVSRRKCRPVIFVLFSFALFCVSNYPVLAVLYGQHHGL